MKTDPTMLYRPDIAEVLQRYRDLYSARRGKILIHIGWPMETRVKWPVLDDYSFPDGYRDFVNAYLDALEQSCAARLAETVNDDSIPTVCASLYGIALHSAFVAGEPVFESNTSWTQPIITEWEILDQLKVDPENRWFRLLSDTNRCLTERARGKYAVCPFLSFGPMDLANALRGNEFFTDLYENPERVHQLLNWCTNAIIMFEEIQKEIVGDQYGGLCVWGAWVPGRAVFLSEDAVNLCSAEMFDQFERPYIERIIRHFGGVYIHTHSLGWHDIPAMAKIPGLSVLQISDDPKQLRPVMCLEELIAKANGVPLMMRCTPDELRNQIKVAVQGRVIFSVNAKDRAEALSIIELCRASEI